MARHQFENENPERPPIDGVGVTRGRDELRREVIWRAASGVRLADDEFGQTHVSDLQHALFVEQKVLGLQVPVDDSAFVQVREALNDTRDIKLRMPLAAMETLAVVCGVQFAAERGLQEEVEGLSAVESLKESNDERGIRHHEDVLLVHDAFLHARLHNKALAQSLHSVRFLCGPVLVEFHRPETAASEQPHLRQILTKDSLLWPVVGVRLGLVTGADHAPTSLPLGAEFLCALDDVLQRPEQHVEGIAVQRQSLGSFRNDGHSGRARLVIQKRALPESLRLVPALARCQSHLLLPALAAYNLPLVENVEGATLLTFLQDNLVFQKVHFSKCLRHRDPLFVQQRLENLHMAQVRRVLRNFLV
mmetsp:Transcript_60282/g.168363  ORF Transcript_60282/g.168363 Transcript_60282/m.168363 type:complete len:362 (+) Transcript_60282:566-1651(+)